MENKKSKIIIFCIIVLVIILLCVSSIISKVRLYTYNPINALIGYVNVKLLDKEYYEVEKDKLIYANEQFNFENYMADRGFKEIKDERLGYMGVYSNGTIKEYVTCWNVMDGYPFSIYEWSDNTTNMIEEEKIKYNELENDAEEIQSPLKINGMVNETESEESLMIQ